jgi:hypothetical protein
MGGSRTRRTRRLQNRAVAYRHAAPPAGGAFRGLAFALVAELVVVLVVVAACMA